jgi:flagellar hook assembly protein FlgD
VLKIENASANYQSSTNQLKTRFLINSFREKCSGTAIADVHHNRQKEKKEKWIMAVSSIAQSASTIQADYMNILIAQLQHQNPLEPMDNNEMASQLAQLSQLGQIETLNASFMTVMANTERSYANSLLDRNVTFFAENGETGELEKQTGKVVSVFNDPETKNSLLGVTVGEGDLAQEYTVGLNAVVLVES